MGETDGTARETGAREKGARSRWQERYAASPVREADFTTLSGMPVEPAYGTDESEWPGEFPFTRGLYPTGYRGRTWTIRQFAGFGNAEQTNERYRMILGRGGGGLSRRLRHAHADGPRLRRPARPRRGRPLRRRGRQRRGHGGALRLHPARPGHHVDDDQRAGGAGLLHVPRRRRAPGRRRRRPQRHAPDRHLQGVRRPEGVALRPRAAPAADRRPDGVLRRAHPGVQAALGVGLPHPRGRLDGRAGAGVHARGRLRVRRARPRRAASTSTSSRPACPSSSTPTWTSSRRSPSSAPRAGSGRGGCATSTARRPRRRSGCGSTPRPPASR